MYERAYLYRNMWINLNREIKIMILIVRQLAKVLGLVSRTDWPLRQAVVQMQGRTSLSFWPLLAFQLIKLEEGQLLNKW